MTMETTEWTTVSTSLKPTITIRELSEKKNDSYASCAGVKEAMSIAMGRLTCNGKKSQRCIFTTQRTLII